MEELHHKMQAIEFILGIGGAENELVPGFRKWPEERLQDYLNNLQTKETALIQQQQPPGVFDMTQITRSLADLRMGITSLQKSFESRAAGSPVATYNSPADFGSSIKNELERDGNFKVFQPVLNEQSILTNQQVIQALEIESENALVMHLTPFLSRILADVDESLVLVNSEQYKWLKATSKNSVQDAKPDLFSAHKAFVTFRSPYQNVPTSDNERFFGQYLCWNCRDSIHVVWEAKLKCDYHSLGEIFIYLQRIGNNTTERDRFLFGLKTRGILFSATHFYLIESKSISINHITQCDWDCPGSLNLLKSFLVVRDPWHMALNEICNKFGYSLEINTSDGSCCFLGRGAFGRVFKLTDGRVLKLVMGKGCSQQVCDEFQHLESAFSKCPTSVLPFVEDSFFCEVGDDEYAGYLLAEVGVSIVPSSKALITVDTVKMIATKLFQLHSNGIIHGDPRLPNILLCQSEYKWIDFRGSNFNSTVKGSIVNDVKIFLMSINSRAEPYWDENVEELIKIYADEVTEEKIMGIIDQIYNSCAVKTNKK